MIVELKKIVRWFYILCAVSAFLAAAIKASLDEGRQWWYILADVGSLVGLLLLCGVVLFGAIWAWSD